MNLISVLPAIRRAGTVAVGPLGILASGAFADSISPTSYSASLGVGEKVTIRKTVTVTEAPPTSALIDAGYTLAVGGFFERSALASDPADDTLATAGAAYVFQRMRGHGRSRPI